MDDESDDTADPPDREDSSREAPEDTTDSWDEAESSWDDTQQAEDDSSIDSDDVQCPECGATLNKYSQFCTECGTQLDEAGGDDQYQQEGQYDQYQQGGQYQQGDQYQQGGQYDQGYQQGGQYQGQGRPPDRLKAAGPESDTGMAAISHILALFLGLIGPIIIYAITDDPFVKQNAANATNWQIMLIVYGIISGILVLLLIGIVFLLALFVMDIAFIIIAAIKASDGEAWEYPLTPELL